VAFPRNLEWKLVKWQVMYLLRMAEITSGSSFKPYRPRILK